MTFVSGDILYQSIAKIAASYNAMGALSIAAYDFENKFDAADAALVFDNTNLTAAKGASIFENTNISIAKIDDILGNANLSDSRASDIIYETDVTTRDLSSASNVIGTAAIVDDWQDNKLTSRDSEATTPISITSPYVQDVTTFRPEWTTVGGTPTVSGGKLNLNAAEEQIATTSTFCVGTWEWMATKNSGTNYYLLAGISQETTGISEHAISSNSYSLGISNTNTDFALFLNNAGAYSNVITSTWSNDTIQHTFKMTRDSSGNFEIFEDGVSKGTAADSTLTSFNYIMIAESTTSDGDHDLDSMKVY